MESPVGLDIVRTLSDFGNFSKLVLLAEVNAEIVLVVGLIQFDNLSGLVFLLRNFLNLEHLIVVHLDTFIRIVDLQGA